MAMCTPTATAPSIMPAATSCHHNPREDGVEVLTGKLSVERGIVGPGGQGGSLRGGCWVLGGGCPFGEGTSWGEGSGCFWLVGQHAPKRGNMPALTTCTYPLAFVVGLMQFVVGLSTTESVNRTHSQSTLTLSQLSQPALNKMQHTKHCQRH